MGAPSAPGDPIEIPHGLGHTIAPPRDWKVEKNPMKGYLLLRPPSGTAAVLADATLTGGPTFGAEISGVVGASGQERDVIEVMRSLR